MSWRSSRSVVIAVFTAGICAAVATLTPMDRTPLDDEPVK